MSGLALRVALGPVSALALLLAAATSTSADMLDLPATAPRVAPAPATASAQANLTALTLRITPPLTDLPRGGPLAILPWARGPEGVPPGRGALYPIVGPADARASVVPPLPAP
jgi:hypothetical protein